MGEGEAKSSRCDFNILALCLLEFRATNRVNNRMSTNANGATGGPAPQDRVRRISRRDDDCLDGSKGGCRRFQFRPHPPSTLRNRHNRFNVWSYRADLLFQGVEQLVELKSVSEIADYVSDGHVIDAAGSKRSSWR